MDTKQIQNNSNIIAKALGFGVPNPKIDHGLHEFQ